jgi:protease II
LGQIQPAPLGLWKQPTDCGSAPEEITLDLNALAEGHPFFSLGMSTVSDDGHLLAYTTDITGFREYTLYIKDLRTGRVLPRTFEKVSSVAWAADDTTIFYVTEDEAKRPYRMWCHRPGIMGSELIHEEPDALFRIGVERSRRAPSDDAPRSSAAYHGRARARSASGSRLPIYAWFGA